ncbi:MAG: DUF1934 domain-containing protein [Clostridia bacterium]|nr:DUF1934 domain-containing protein [Clostridia bacterium]
MLKAKLFFHSSAGGVEFRKSYEATVNEKADKITIIYVEIDENGVTECEIAVVSNDFVAVRRTGEFSNYLEFKENYLYKGEYQTPYGEIPVEAFTKKLCVSREKGVLKVDAEYKSSLAGEVTENNFGFLIKI